MAKAKHSQVQIPSARSEDQPATRKMLALVRDELKSDIRGLEQKMESGFQKVASDFQKVTSDFHKLEAGNSRMQLLFEEQNANNRIVLEGLQALWQRQEKLEQRLS